MKKAIQRYKTYRFKKWIDSNVSKERQKKLNDALTALGKAMREQSELFIKGMNEFAKAMGEIQKKRQGTEPGKRKDWKY